MQTPERLLENVIDITREAAEVVLSIYESDFSVQIKHDQSPLTRADVAAHHLIKHRLAGLAPGCPILSEESTVEEKAGRHAWSRFWLVDPLDGTREFIDRNGEFSINIALIEEGAPVLGVIMAPVTGTLWYATRGGGARRAHEGRIERITVAPLRAGRAVRVVGSRSHVHEELEGLLKRLEPLEWQGIGSSLKFCRIAEGFADCYLRPGPTCEWDTGAGQIILEEAGGCVRRLEGGEVKEALRYNRRETLINPDFIALGDRAIAGMLTDFHKRN